MINQVKSFIKLLPKLFLLSIAIYIVNNYVVTGIISFVLQFALRVTGIQIAFNMSILEFVLTIPGFICFFIAIFIITITIYYEYALIVLCIHNWRNSTKTTYKTILVNALYSLKNLKHISSIGFLIYAFALLPLSTLGLHSSFVSRVMIPNFVSGEIAKFSWGSIVLLLIPIILALVFFLLIYTLPSMVLENQNFYHAMKSSIRNIKKSYKQFFTTIIIYISIWLVLHWIPNYLYEQAFHSSIISIGMIFEHYHFSWQFFLLLPITILYFIGNVMLMPLLLSLITINYQLSDNTKQAIDLRLGELYTKQFSNLGFIKATNTKPKLKILCKISIFILCLALGSSTYSVLRIPAALHEPIVIGHRGSDKGVENTIEAIQGAIDANAEYAEIDILLSKDGVPMVIHDTNLSRLANQNLNVYDLTAAELSELTLSQNGYEGKISTLDEVLVYCDGKIDLVIELKLHGKEKKNLIDEIMKVVDKYDYEEHIMFLSLDYQLVEEANTKHPSIDAGFCVFGEIGILDSSIIKTMNIDFIFIEESMATAENIYKFRASWIPVYVWTANDSIDMKKYLDAGILGIVSDKPYIARTVVDQFIEYTKIEFLEEYEWKLD